MENEKQEPFDYEKAKQKVKEHFRTGKSELCTTCYCLIMNYPLEILPNEKYKKIDCKIGESFIVRLITGHDIDEIYNTETNRVNITSIFTPAEV